MKYRVPLLLIGLLLPIIVAIVVTRFALPEVLPVSAENTTVAKSPRTIPDTLDEAKKLTIARLAHLQTLSQEQWDKERKTIAFKNPPPTINAAIARTQLRIADLNQMSEEQWKAEKERLKNRQ